MIYSSVIFQESCSRHLDVLGHFQQLNALTSNVPHHIETSQLIYIANQLTGFYITRIFIG